MLFNFVSALSDQTFNCDRSLSGCSKCFELKVRKKFLWLFKNRCFCQSWLVSGSWHRFFRHSNPILLSWRTRPKGIEFFSELSSFKIFNSFESEEFNSGRFRESDSFGNSEFWSSLKVVRNQSGKKVFFDHLFKVKPEREIKKECGQQPKKP